MTLLNEIPILGLAKDFLDQDKWKKACWWYVLTYGQIGFSAEVEPVVRVIVEFDDGKGRGLGGACILDNKKGESVASGYLMNTSEVKPYKYEMQRNLREL